MPSKNSDVNSGIWTILKILTWTESYFSSFNIDCPRLTAEILLCHCLGIKRIDLYLQYDRPLDKKELVLYKNFIKRRVKREPVAYITGYKGFWESDFKVNPGVLIPRPDTEVLVEVGLAILGGFKRNKKTVRVLELGSGSGAVIISLAKEYPLNTYFALDISYDAARTTAFNADTILCDTQVFTFVGSWFSSLRQNLVFDIIISNPPYIPSKEIDALQPEISGYEPRIALDGGADGLLSIREIIQDAWKFLNPDGFLLIETGCDQKSDVEKTVWDCKCYGCIKYMEDYAGHNRVALIRKK